MSIVNLNENQFKLAYSIFIKKCRQKMDGYDRNKNNKTQETKQIYPH